MKSVNDLDVKINELIEQLNSLFDRRLQLVKEPAHHRTPVSRESDEPHIDFDDIDLTLN